MDTFFATIAVVGTGCLSYFFYIHFYTSHSLFTTTAVFDWKRRLPGYVYLLIRYISRSVWKKRGQLTEKNTNDELAFSLINCRYEATSLRRYCSAVGYGGDYPDSEFRDIPLLYPEFLFARLLNMVVCSDRFKLNPRGLVRVCETVQLLQPLDELKRGTFSLQVEVMEYRSVSGGVEVVLRLSAKSLQQGELVWTSILTLLSPRAAYTHTLQLDAQDAEGMCVRCVKVAVPWWAGVGGVCSEHVLPVPVSVLGYGCPTSLWSLSRCLAETEKLKGAEAMRAPLTLTVRYTHPLSLPKAVNIRISETTAGPDTQPCRNYVLHMEDQRTGALLLMGAIERL
ncbi:uncharacterized protein si:ch211-12e13.1 isoform X1 [Electrophorus electricus]|uniref:uncharacterized protein si:ch211-12e13.1 isoform X1 n=1 Tax=Electrophorus electricus TaxID=8005 RepID=UPI0015D011BB|nr:uncharacterized protein si:ch211-12e13.1 isoform X1 [Electrophorus electricus]